MLLEDLQDDPKGEIIEKPMVFQYFYSKVSVSLETSSEKYSPTAGGVHSPHDFSDTHELTDMGREFHLAPFAINRGRLNSRGE